MLVKEIIAIITMMRDRTLQISKNMITNIMSINIKIAKVMIINMLR